jgi:hypothetical protein
MLFYTVGGAEVLTALKSASPQGLEDALVNDILSSAKCIYLREDFTYEYSNELCFDFKPNADSWISDFIDNYKTARWLVE